MKCWWSIIWSATKKRFVTRGKDSTVSLLWPSFWPGVTAKSGSISFAGTEAIPVFHWIWTGIMYRFEPAEGNNRTDLDIHLESWGINISTEENRLPHGLVWRNHPPGLVVVELGTPKDVKPWNPMNQWDAPPRNFYILWRFELHCVCCISLEINPPKNLSPFLTLTNLLGEHILST